MTRPRRTMPARRPRRAARPRPSATPRARRRRRRAPGRPRRAGGRPAIEPLVFLHRPAPRGSRGVRASARLALRDGRRLAALRHGRRAAQTAADGSTTATRVRGVDLGSRRGRLAHSGTRRTTGCSCCSRRRAAAEGDLIGRGRELVRRGQPARRAARQARRAAVRPLRVQPPQVDAAAGRLPGRHHALLRPDRDQGQHGRGRRDRPAAPGRRRGAQPARRDRGRAERGLARAHRRQAAPPARSTRAASRSRKARAPRARARPRSSPR